MTDQTKTPTPTLFAFVCQGCNECYAATVEQDKDPMGPECPGCQSTDRIWLQGQELRDEFENEFETVLEFKASLPLSTTVPPSVYGPLAGLADTVKVRIASAIEGRGLARLAGDTVQVARMNGYIDAMTEIALQVNALRYAK